MNGGIRSADSLNGNVGFACYHDVSGDMLKEAAQVHGHSFAVVPFLRKQNSLRTFKYSLENPLYIPASDLQIDGTDYGLTFRAIIDFTDEAESADDLVRLKAEEIINAQISYAKYMGISILYFRISEELSESCKKPVNLARIINGILTTYGNLKICIIVSARQDIAQSQYETWDYIRTLCCHSVNLFMVPQFLKTEELKIADRIKDEPILEAWVYGPLIYPLNVLAQLNEEDGKAYMYQDALYNLFKVTTKIAILYDSDTLNILNVGSTCRTIISEYIASYNRKNSITGVDVDLYDDYLQYPLQPLANNLENSVYETFERDTKKYELYEKAITAALIDYSAVSNNPDSIVVMVLGAGRGPLVGKIMKVAASIPKHIEVYAIEKNQNAVTTLQGLNEAEWSNKVNIVFADMRSWNPPKKADIIISELLGSFGDNELSPECLNVAMTYLKDSGISIPSTYSSYMSPVSYAKIYHALSSNSSNNNPLTIPYVVKLKSARILAKPQLIWTFSHEPVSENDKEAVLHRSYNNREASLRFLINEDSTLHGLSGYFDTVLYNDINISIVEGSSTEGVHSWFPMFFPLKRPIKMKKGNYAVVHIWRLSSNDGVWYEWTLSQEEPVFAEDGREISTRCIESTEIHNSRGTSIMWKISPDMA